jgi:hypothetical protein
MTRRIGRIGRVAVSYLLAPDTVAALRSRSEASGAPMSRVIDQAVAALNTAPLRAAIAELETASKTYARGDEDAIAAHWRAIGALSVCLSRMARAAGEDELADRALGPTTGPLARADRARRG